MGTIQLAEPQRFKKLVWFTMPILLLAALAIGGITINGAHAANSNSPLSGTYNLRAIVKAGPATKLYLTGEMSLNIDGSGNIKGAMCGLKISEQRCSSVTGSTTINGSSMHLSISHLKGFSTDLFSGAYQSTAGKRGGFNGFTGLFTLGTSSGTWEARSGTTPVLSNSWNVFGVVQKGPDVGQQFHGKLTLSEGNNGVLKGSYCPGNGGSCSTALGGRDRYGYIYFYVDVSAFNQTIRLRGTVVSGNAGRISGQFESLNPKIGDRGYWLGH